jgi:hypothetical protein
MFLNCSEYFEFYPADEFVAIPAFWQFVEMNRIRNTCCSDKPLNGI